MRRTVRFGDKLARSLLLPGTVACHVLGLRDHKELVRMLINSLVWTVLGVTTAAFII